MLFSIIKSDILKFKRSPIWIAILILPIIASIMGTFNYLQNISILKKEWFSLWTQHTLFTSFFFLPALIGIICAYEWRLEHKENNWNMIMTKPVPIFIIILSKLIVCIGFVFLIQIFTLVLFLLSGKFIGFTSLPPKDLPLWIFLGTLGSVSIVSLQLPISMLTKNFGIPIGISLIGGILGVAFTSNHMGLYFPYSLISLGMNANGMNLLTASNITSFLSMCTLFTIIPYIISVVILKKIDISTN